MVDQQWEEQSSAGKIWGGLAWTNGWPVCGREGCMEVTRKQGRQRMWHSPHPTKIKGKKKLTWNILVFLTMKWPPMLYKTFSLLWLFWWHEHVDDVIYWLLLATFVHYLPCWVFWRPTRLGLSGKRRYLARNMFYKRCLPDNTDYKYST